MNQHDIEPEKTGDDGDYLHIGPTPWPAGINASSWTTDAYAIWSVRNAWAIVADLDAAGVPWQMICPDDPIFYVPDDNEVAAAILEGAAMSRMNDDPLFWWIHQSDTDYRVQRGESTRPKMTWQWKLFWLIAIGGILFGALSFYGMEIGL